MPNGTNVNVAVQSFANVTVAGTTPTGVLENVFHRGVKLVIDITALGAVTTLQVTIQGYDSVSNKAYTLLQSAALNATGTTVLTVYPGAVVAANASANDVLPARWKVSSVIVGTAGVTATVAASLLL